MQTGLKLHTPDPHALKRSADIYSRSRTPEVHEDGTIEALDVRPGGPRLAADHVREIHRSFGPAGVRHTLGGLQAMRGNQFVLQMLAVDPGISGLATAAATRSAVRNVVESGRTGVAVPEAARDAFEAATGADVGGVEIYSDSASHAAAAALGARAFTLGQKIYFNQGELQPGTAEGQGLIFHELTHTLQQRGATPPETDALSVGSPHDTHEREADAVARSVKPRAANTAPSQLGEQSEPTFAGAIGTTQRIQRAITFSIAGGTPHSNRVSATEFAAEFLITSDPAITFDWQPDITIHGSAGDPFADWEAGVHQVGKVFWHHVDWGTGTPNHSRRRATITGGLPMRDAVDPANTWYADVAPTKPAAFSADRDVRSPFFDDTPAYPVPYANPVVGRAGSVGSFTHGVGFVTTMSARHIPTGTGAAAFRHLAHRHWTLMVDGTFDGTKALGTRVSARGGTVSNSPMILGHDSAFPPMHGGVTMNTAAIANNDT